MTQYLGFEIRQTPTQWQGVRPCDLLWTDGYQGKTLAELKARIECFWNGF